MIFEKIFKKEIEQFSHEIEEIKFNQYGERESSYSLGDNFNGFISLKGASYDKNKAITKYNFIMKTSFGKIKIGDNIISKDGNKYKTKLINKKKFDNIENIYELYLEKIESI